MNLLGIDFEDWYHPELIQNHIENKEYEPTMYKGLGKILTLLEKKHNENITSKTTTNILFNLLKNQKGKTNGFPVDLYTHQIQTATRAYRDGADNETIVCCLFHDIGEDISPSNHGEIPASMLRPYISKKNHFILEKHEIFQSKYYMHHFGLDSNKREYFKDNMGEIFLWNVGLQFGR